MRLDRWFRVHFPDVTYGYLQKLLRSGQVRVDSRRVQANARLEAGPAGARAERRAPAGEGEALGDAAARRSPRATATSSSAMILFEDEHVVVLNKPYGIAVQGGTGTRRHIDGLLAGMVDRFGDRPRLVHRLDRDTTGVLLVAKHRDAAAKLGRIFQTRSAAKTYWALVKGVPKPPQGKIEAALVKAAGPDGEDRVRKALPGEQAKAMHATTHYSVIDRVAHKAAWVSLKPVTGRQHQLRAHMALIGNPIVGDNKYEGDKVLADSGIEAKLHLHARRLVIPHPAAGQPRSTSRRLCPSTCARAGSCWASTRPASTRTRRGRRTLRRPRHHRLWRSLHGYGLALADVPVEPRHQGDGRARDRHQDVLVGGVL